MKQLLALFFVVCTIAIQAQSFTPFLGHVTNHSAIINCDVNHPTLDLKFIYTDQVKTDTLLASRENEFLPFKLTLTALKANTPYQIQFIIPDGNINSDTFSFTTKEANFLTSKKKYEFYLGSCLYINDTLETYGKGTEVLNQVNPADFMIWSGDFTYYRGKDYDHIDRMNQRWRKTRLDSNYLNFNFKMPSYVIWDDHDFGPNNANSEFELKETSLNVFQHQTANPSYGQKDQPGVYFNIDYHNNSFFFLDNRYYRTVDSLPDSQYLGKAQYQWLTQELLKSKSSFKFIVSGSQVTNTFAVDEVMCKSSEYDSLIQFIVKNKIEGVVFLSGDRHFSEILKTDIPNGYPIYEITSSPISSRAFTPWGKFSIEKDNQLRVKNMVNEQNIALIKVKGRFRKRLDVSFINKQGQVKLHHQIDYRHLRF